LSEKELRASKVVKNYMWWSAGAGLIPVPFVDLLAVSGVQLRMLAEVSGIYGVEFQESRGKLVIAALIGYIVPNVLSFGSIASVLKAVPVVGTLVGAPSMGIFCGASTYAVGKVFVQHFEAGGTFLSFHAANVKEFFQKEFEVGRKLVKHAEKERPVAEKEQPVAAAV
jgi:uncharacterized protein (DUF697 family)